MHEHIIEVANAIHLARYEGASLVLTAGSIVRGEGTPFSDLDLVVLYPQLANAYRESFRFGDYPVEAFVHDPETLEYFMVEVDRPSGVPALAQMVVEGLEVPAPTELSRTLKQRAAAIIAAGPPPLDSGNEQRMRYFVSDLLDDLRAPRSADERVGAGSQLYEQLADYHLRRRGLWSARGKAIPRVLRAADERLCETYCDAFRQLFANGDSTPAIRLAEALMSEAGGPLFEGYRADAPPTWRTKRPGTAV